MFNTVKRINIFSKPKGVKYILFFLLILLNFVIRIPSIPHIKGYDTFYIFPLANSLSTYGDAQWWINSLSVFGFYAYSYASAVPFIISGIHQLTVIEMEYVILLYCVIIGLFSIFTAYIVAGRFYSNFSFKYGVALFFSLAPGIMLFSTWELSSRGLFMILLPLFIYLILSKIKLIKKIILVFILIVFQFAIHHYSFFLVPILVVYFSIILLEKTKYYGIIKSYSHYFIFIVASTFIILPFISRSLVDSGSRYGWLIISAVTIFRQVGPLMILSVGGYFYLLLKKDKTAKELYLLFIFTLFIPAIYSHNYGAFILLLFIVLFIGIAFSNMTFTEFNKKYSSIFLIVIVLLTVMFGSYYNHYRTGDSDSYWYVGQDTYAAGVWGRNYVPDNSYGLDTALETSRMFSISEGHPITPNIGAVNLAYGFINESEIEYIEHSYFEKDFYFEGPYAVKPGTTVAGTMEWIKETTTSVEQLKRFNYFVQDNYYSKPVTIVVAQQYNKIYSNPRITIWEYSH